MVSFFRRRRKNGNIGRTRFSDSDGLHIGHIHRIVHLGDLCIFRGRIDQETAVHETSPSYHIRHIPHKRIGAVPGLDCETGVYQQSSYLEFIGVFGHWFFLCDGNKVDLAGQLSKIIHGRPLH